MDTSDVVSIAGGIVTVLAVAVGALWRMQIAAAVQAEKRLTEQVERTDKKLDECEEGHKQAAIVQIATAEKIGRLEGLMDGHSQARADVQDEMTTIRKLSEEVLERMHKHDGKDDS